MRRKMFTHTIVFSTTPEVYDALKEHSDEFRISLSDLMRRVSEDYLNGTRTYSRHRVEETGLSAIEKGEGNE